MYDLLHKGGVATLKLLQGDDPEKTAQAPGMEEVNVHSLLGGCGIVVSLAQVQEVFGAVGGNANRAYEQLLSG